MYRLLKKLLQKRRIRIGDIVEVVKLISCDKTLVKGQLGIVVDISDNYDDRPTFIYVDFKNDGKVNRYPMLICQLRKV